MAEVDSESIRQIVSYGGKCEFACLHCYTSCNGYKSEGLSSTEKIIDDLKNKDFKIVYISGHRENFINPNMGIELAEKIYEEFRCNLLLTTRNVFDDSQIDRIAYLNNKMKTVGKNLYFCISIPALDSYKKMEPNGIIPSPLERIEFLIKLSKKGIITFLTIRPLCPNSFIPINEPLEIIKRCKGYAKLVVASGIVVDEKILSQLKGFPKDFIFTESFLMSCLKNKIKVKYVDVDYELSLISKYCREEQIPFFNESMEAIRYIEKYDFGEKNLKKTYFQKPVKLSFKT